MSGGGGAMMSGGGGDTGETAAALRAAHERATELIEARETLELEKAALADELAAAEGSARRAADEAAASATRLGKLQEDLEVTIGGRLKSKFDFEVRTPPSFRDVASVANRVNECRRDGDLLEWRRRERCGGRVWGAPLPEDTPPPPPPRPHDGRRARSACIPAAAAPRRRPPRFSRRLLFPSFLVALPLETNVFSSEHSPVGASCSSSPLFLSRLPRGDARTRRGGSRRRSRRPTRSTPRSPTRSCARRPTPRRSARRRRACGGSRRSSTSPRSTARSLKKRSR